MSPEIQKAIAELREDLKRDLNQRLQQFDREMTMRLTDLKTLADNTAGAVDDVTFTVEQMEGARKSDLFVGSGLDVNSVLSPLGSRRVAIHFPPSTYDFAPVRVSGNVFTIKAGEIQIGSSVAVAVADTNVTITEDGSRVGWRYDYSTKDLTIVNYGAAGPTYNGTTWQKWLYQFSYDTATTYAAIERYGWLNTTKPSIYADEPT